MTYIGGVSFSYCSSLTSINIPPSVTYIGDHAFRYCESLTEIVLPKSIEHIGSQAFSNCSELLGVYCHAETVPSTESDAFNGSYPEYITLHVPASALNAYKTTAPWSSFGTFKTFADTAPLEKCATPTIGYTDGKVIFACDTEEVTIISNFKNNNESNYSDLEVSFVPTYTITAYATKEKYEDSDVATLTLCWIPCTEEHEEDNGIINIPAKPVLIQTDGGTITVNGLAEGTVVKVNDLNGVELGTATATGGTATITTSLTAGSVAVVQIGDYTIKVAIK